jgi:hypothetical protein
LTHDENHDERLTDLFHDSGFHVGVLSSSRERRGMNREHRNGRRQTIFVVPG